MVVAAAVGSAALLFAALLVHGAGSAANLQARYAGTDLAEPRRRGAAVSVALVSTTAGAVTGPDLVVVTGALVEGWGLPALAGPFALAGAAYLAAGAVLLVLLRPDPYLVAMRLHAAAGAPSAAAPTRVHRGVVRGAAVLGDSVAASAVALVLLGLGWNMGLISGTAMVVDATTAEERGRAQGSVDVLVGLAGYGVLALLGGALAAALVPLLLLLRPSARTAVA